MAEQMTDAALRQQIARWTRAALGPLMEDDGLLAGGFPDAHFLIEDHIAEGNKVVTRWRAHAIHQGPFKGRFFWSVSGKP